MTDIKYLGIPNICFSLTSEDDPREGNYSKQRIERGFDDSETWSLCDTISRFILPRLKRFKELYPDESDEQFIEDIDLVILALELITRDKGIRIFSEQEKKIVETGLEKLPIIFMGLWW